MEDKLVSKHILDASQYVGKGKWKGVIQGWVVFLIIYGITRIPNVQQAMLDFANSMKGVAWLSSGVNFIVLYTFQFTKHCYKADSILIDL